MYVECKYSLSAAVAWQSCEATLEEWQSFPLKHTRGLFLGATSHLKSPHYCSMKPFSPAPFGESACKPFIQISISTSMNMEVKATWGNAFRRAGKKEKKKKTDQHTGSRKCDLLYLQFVVLCCLSVYQFVCACSGGLYVWNPTLTSGMSGGQCLWNFLATGTSAPSRLRQLA